jgi:hypothetical protein
VPDRHSVFLPLIENARDRRTLWSFIFIAQDAAVFLSENAPLGAAATPAHIGFPLLVSADENVVHQVVRARQEGQRRTVVAVGDTEAPTRTAPGGAWAIAACSKARSSSTRQESSRRHGQVFCTWGRTDVSSRAVARDKSYNPGVTFQAPSGSHIGGTPQVPHSPQASCEAGATDAARSRLPLVSLWLRRRDSSCIRLRPG